MQVTTARTRESDHPCRDDTLTPQSLPKGLSRRFASSATAHAVEEPAAGIVRTPRRVQHWPQRQRAPTPAWAWLESGVHSDLFVKSPNRPRPSAAAFRVRFDGLNVSPTLLLPCERLRAVFDVFSAPDTTEGDWHWLSIKFKQIKEAKPDYSDLPESEVLFTTLRALALAKTGDWEYACAVMSTAVKKALDTAPNIENYPLFNAAPIELYVKTVLEAGRTKDIALVVRYGGQRFQKLLCTLPAQAASQNVGKESQRVRAAFMTAVCSLDDPWAWILTQVGDLPEGRTVNSVYHTAIVLLTAFICNKARTIEAFSLWRKITAKFNSTFISPSTTSLLAANLAEENYDDAASHVLAAMRESGGLLPHNALSRELWIYANQAKPSETLAVWDEINKRHRPTHRDRLAVATAFAVNGQIDAARKALVQLGSSETSVDALRLLHRAAVIAEDDVLALDYLNQIAAIEPSLLPFEVQLRLYAQQGKVEEAIGLFGRIVELDLKPTLKTYTTFISVFATAGDFVNAQLVFKSMQASGHEPDAPAWCALLNAYVEAGAWEEAARRVEEVPPEMQRDPDVLTTLLKAYVLAAAPLEPVLRLFRSIPQAPGQAWALVIQSAADNDNMVLARSLFVEMDTATKLDTLAPPPSVHIFSILLAAYLRVGDRESARSVYDTMIQRQIIPSSISYAIITNSFAKAPGESSFDQAHNFAMSVYSQINPGERTRARGKAMENVFTPLLIASVRSGDLSQAKRYYDLITQSGGSSRALSTKLMEAYRHAGELKPMYRVWLKLFRHACKAIPVHEHQSADQVVRKRNNVLCIPFSIAIRAFGDSGMHDRLKGLWAQMRDAGFGRDSQNYNHYAVALAQTGDLESAFHIVERVLLPRYDEVMQRYYRAMRAADGELAPVDADSSPADIVVDIEDGDDVYVGKHHLVEDEEVDAEFDEQFALTTDDVAEPEHRPPNRRHQFHPTAPQSLVDGLDASDSGVDLAILRQWRPSDILWRPSLATIATLDQAYRQLEDQRAYRAWVGVTTSDDTEAEGGEAEHVEAGEGEQVHLPEFRTVVKNPDGTPQRLTPKFMLARLNRKYAKVVSLIMFHRRKRERALALEKRERRR